MSPEPNTQQTSSPSTQTTQQATTQTVNNHPATQQTGSTANAAAATTTTTTQPDTTKATDGNKAQQTTTTAQPVDTAGKPAPLSWKDAALPEGVTVKADDPMAQEFLGIINDEKLDQKGRFNALANFFPKVQERIAEDNLRTWIEMQDTWVGDLKKEHGSLLPEKLGRVNALMTEYNEDMQGRQAAGTQKLDFMAPLKEAATITGAGNNPAWMNFIMWVAERSGEGRPLTGSPAGGGERNPATILFGGSK